MRLIPLLLVLFGILLSAPAWAAAQCYSPTVRDDPYDDGEGVACDIEIGPRTTNHCADGVCTFTSLFCTYGCPAITETPIRDLICEPGAQCINSSGNQFTVPAADPLDPQSSIAYRAWRTSSGWTAKQCPNISCRTVTWTERTYDLPMPIQPEGGEGDDDSPAPPPADPTEVEHQNPLERSYRGNLGILDSGKWALWDMGVYAESGDRLPLRETCVGVYDEWGEYIRSDCDGWRRVLDGAYTPTWIVLSRGDFDGRQVRCGDDLAAHTLFFRSVGGRTFSARVTEVDPGSHSAMYRGAARTASVCWMDVDQFSIEAIGESAAQARRYIGGSNSRIGVRFPFDPGPGGMNEE